MPKGVVAFEAEQEDDDLLAAGAVGGVFAVFVADLRGCLLRDHAVHGCVVEDAERAMRHLERKRSEKSRVAAVRGVAGRQGEKEEGLQAGAHEPSPDGEVGAEELG